MHVYVRRGGWGWAKREFERLSRGRVTYRVIVVCILANKFQGGGGGQNSSKGDGNQEEIFLDTKHFTGKGPIMQIWSRIKYNL